ncbi:hypothetical protein FB567DRAFT_630392 [Paraphoma chrysanthemicola]|uniref:Uncharacterized protein n=1 Tax=Paraphoma chrysanthemicola TaxID=798071 RepID=A0A8K0VWF5_9PLEO|nr:hypothetical protein FB567DRAFT_630392 [Paraphoma chrysanthemicola]
MGKFDKVKEFDSKVRAERRAQQVKEEQREYASSSPQRQAVIEARWVLRDIKPEPGFYLYGDGSSLVEVYSTIPGELDDREIESRLPLGHFWMPLHLEMLTPALQRLPYGVRFPIALAFESGCIDTYVRVKSENVGMVDMGMFPQNPDVWLKAAQTAVPVVWYTNDGILKSEPVSDRAQVGYQPNQFVFLEMKGRGRQKTWKPMDETMTLEMVHVPWGEVGGTKVMAPLPSVLSGRGPLWSPALFPPTLASASASASAPFPAPISGPLLPSASWSVGGVPFGVAEPATSGLAVVVPSGPAGGIVTHDTPPNSREVTASNSSDDALFLALLDFSTSASHSALPPLADYFSEQPSVSAPAPAGPISNNLWANYAPAGLLGSGASAETSLPPGPDYAMQNEAVNPMDEFIDWNGGA